MTVSELKEKGALYFSNIKEGFDHCVWEHVSMNGAEAYECFWNMWIEAGQQDGYVDFYYYRLTAEEQAKVDSVLTADEQQYLKEILPKGQIPGEEEIIFPMDEMLLQIIAKLNETEMLFSTVYFTGDKSTWWGNYRGEYVVFRD